MVPKIRDERRGERTMGHKFSLVLSREITDDESAILQNAGCSEAVFLTDSLPTNANVTVTRMDFDDTSSPSLAEAIEAALEAVKKVPDLSVPGLTVPAVPRADAEASDALPGGIVAGEVLVGEDAEEKPTPKKAPAKKAAAKKAPAKKAVAAAE
jgi:hypothetical protein